MNDQGASQRQLVALLRQQRRNQKDRVPQVTAASTIPLAASSVPLVTFLAQAE